MSISKSSTFSIILILICSLISTTAAEECQPESTAGGGSCYNKHESLNLKVIAIFALLFTSMIGVASPMFLSIGPEKNLFIIIKAFASGVILATGYMHVLPDSFECLTSPCLPENPWRKFPFTTFVAMLSALLTMMIDSFAMSSYKRNQEKLSADPSNRVTDINLEGGHVGHFHGNNAVVLEGESQLLRYRVVAQVLELGIVVHSVVIGLSMGASHNVCTIRPLIAALCFHQLFEGMGLGGCILQAEYGFKIKAIMAFFFAATTPFGIVLGIGLSNVYSDNSSTALIVVGLLNACSAGLLNYMALVDLLAADFMGTKLQNNVKLQIWAYVAVLLGAGGMSLMAKWA